MKIVYNFRRSLIFFRGNTNTSNNKLFKRWEEDAAKKRSKGEHVEEYKYIYSSVYYNGPEETNSTPSTRRRQAGGTSRNTTPGTPRTRGARTPQQPWNALRCLICLACPFPLHLLFLKLLQTAPLPPST